MCTLKTDRKIPTRTHGPPSNGSFSSSITSLTLPSAGLTITMLVDWHDPFGVAKERE